MGLGIGFSHSSYDSEKTPGAVSNPNPKNYKILHHVIIGRFLIIEILYPDAKNYEGKKILVYKDTSLEDLENQGSIDPHFSDNKEFKSPFARFEPTEEGFLMAFKLAQFN